MQNMKTLMVGFTVALFLNACVVSPDNVPDCVGRNAKSDACLALFGGLSGRDAGTTRDTGDSGVLTCEEAEDCLSSFDACISSGGGVGICAPYCTNSSQCGSSLFCEDPSGGRCDSFDDYCRCAY